MNWMLLTVLLASSPAEPPVTPVLTTEAVCQIGPSLQTGTLIFSQGDCLAIRVYTQSPYTHVAAVVIRHGEPMVYDTTGGPGVRCQTFEKYLASQGTADLFLLQPKEKFPEGRCLEFEKYLDSQLGRPYSVQHHLTGNRVAGLHCAEYLTDTLMHCKMIKAKAPAKVSPASLRTGLLQAKLYDHSTTFRLTTAELPVVAEKSWCSQSWDCTTGCTSFCWRKMRGWFCCQ